MDASPAFLLYRNDFKGLQERVVFPVCQSDFPASDLNIFSRHWAHPAKPEAAVIILVRRLIQATFTQKEDTMSRKGFTRRRFIKTGLMTAGAAALGAGVLKPLGLWAATPKINVNEKTNTLFFVICFSIPGITIQIPSFS